MNRRNLLGAIGAAVGASGAGATTMPGQWQAPGAWVAAADGTRLFVRDWGTGAPILFLAGWALPSDFWGYQMRPLAQQGHRCVAFDRRGHGRSDDPGRHYDYDHLADDLHSVIEQRQLRDLTVVAHSMGAGELAEYLSRHGSQRIRNIVLVAPTTPWVVKTPDNPGGIDPAYVKAGLDLIARDFPKWIDDNAPPFFVPETSGALVSWGKGLLLNTSLLAACECARLVAETDFRARLKRFDRPTLIVHGDRDMSAPLGLTGRASAALIPGARLEVYAGAPHGLALTHTHRLNEDIQRFAAA